MQASITLANFPPETLARARRRMDVRRQETPGIVVLKNLVSLPQYDCLYDVSGRRIEDSRRVNIPHDLATPHVLDRDERSSIATEPRTTEMPQALDVVEEPVLFVGSIWPHYGHYIIDGMSRFWALDVAPDLPLLLQNRPAVRNHGHAYISEIHARLALSARGLISPERPTLFKTVHLAKPSFLHTFRAYECHQDPHLKVASSILEEGTEGQSEKVYLTRSQLKPHERGAVQEVEIEDRLRREGFAIVAPERVAFADQVRLFNRAKWIVGTIGSAFHTSLFAGPDPDRTLFTLCWEKINPRYLMIDEIKRQNSIYLNCVSVDTIDARDRISKTTVDVELAMAELDAAGAFA